MIQWKLKELKIGELKPHPKNPRQIGKEQFERLSNLIGKFGLIDKPIVNADMMIIGGHQRINVLKKKKEKLVECWVAENQLTDEDIDELCIGLNLQQGSWDWDQLANNFDMLDLLKWGFSEEQLLDHVKESEEIISDQKEGKKKLKSCPSCGHEF